jgi:hypothetical protein
LVFRINTQAAQAGDAEDFIKLEITLKVNYVNTLDPEDQWEQNFSKFELLSSNEDLASVEDEKIQAISEQLSENIFNAALAQW